jgi:hypothetical protein
VKLDFIMDFLGQNLLSPASVFTWLYTVYTGYTKGDSVVQDYNKAFEKRKKNRKYPCKKEVKNCLKKKDRIKSWSIKKVFPRRDSNESVAAEPEFVNVWGAQESILPAYVARRTGTINVVVVPAHWLHKLAESIPRPGRTIMYPWYRTPQCYVSLAGL